MFSKKEKKVTRVEVDLKAEKVAGAEKLTTFQISEPNHVPADAAARRMSSAGSSSGNLAGSTMSNLNNLETTISGQLAHPTAAHMERPAASVNKITTVGMTMQQMQSFRGKVTKFCAALEAYAVATHELSDSLQEVKRIGGVAGSLPALDHDTTSELSGASTSLQTEQVAELDELITLLQGLETTGTSMAASMRTDVETPAHHLLEQMLDTVKVRREKNDETMREKATLLQKLEKESYKKSKKKHMDLHGVQESLVERINLSNEIQALESDNITFHDRLAASKLARVAELCAAALAHARTLVSGVSDLEPAAETSAAVAAAAETTVSANASPAAEKAKIATQAGTTQTPPVTPRAGTPDETPAAPERPAPTVPVV